jgi:uncharacterized protein involved in exopolysaccharide biosynthesis
MPGDDDTYAREFIRTVEDMTRQLVAFRQDITRAMAPMYPRIVEIEKQLEQEARERPARQKELDSKLEKQNAVASQQGAAIQQTIQALNAHGETLERQNRILDRIYHWQFWGRVFDIVLIGGFGIALIVWWLSSR